MKTRKRESVTVELSAIDLLELLRRCYDEDDNYLLPSLQDAFIGTKGKPRKGQKRVMDPVVCVVEADNGERCIELSFQLVDEGA